MSGLEAVTSSVEDILLDDLSFTPKPGASYLLSKTMTRFHPAGSDIYNPTSGTKVCRLNLTADTTSWMNPASVRVMFDIHNKHETHPLRLLTGPWGMWNRLTIRMNGTQVKDIGSYGRLYEQVHRSQSKAARQRELDLGICGEIDEYGDAQTEMIGAGSTKTVTMNLLSGLLSGQSKYIWLSASPLTIELELAAFDANLQAGINYSGT